MAANRKFRPRGSAYNQQRDAQRDSNSPSDDHTLNTALCKVQLVRPTYKKGFLVVRPWPALSMAGDGVLLSGRKTAEERWYNDWLIKVPVCKFVGTVFPVSFILYAPWRKEEDRMNNPYNVLFYNALKAFKSTRFGSGRTWDGSWNLIMNKQGGTAGGAKMTKSTHVWYMQATVYANGDRAYTGADRQVALGEHASDPLQVVQISNEAGENMIRICDTKRTDANGVPTAFDETRNLSINYRYGDPTGVYDPVTATIKGGLFLSFYNPKVSTFATVHTSFGGTISNMQGYECGVQRSYKGIRGNTYSADLSAVQVKHIQNQAQYWFDDANDATAKGLLHIPSVDEQCLLLARAFRDVPLLLEYAWFDHPEFLTQDVLAVLREKQAAVMPGAADGAPVEAPTRGPRTDPSQTSQPADEFDTPAAGAVPAAAAAPVADHTQLPEEFEDPTAGDAATEASAPADEFDALADGAAAAAGTVPETIEPEVEPDAPGGFEEDNGSGEQDGNERQGGIGRGQAQVGGTTQPGPCGGPGGPGGGAEGTEGEEVRRWPALWGGRAF